MKTNLDKILTENGELTDSDIDGIVVVIGHGCRQKTKEKLRRRLSMPALMPNYGIYRRLEKDEYGWSYCAGQSYTDEIRTVRECILEG